MTKNADPRSLAEFQRRVRSFYKKSGRHSLPWRKTKDPYKILVSEIMLQQTQVHRVVPKYRAFLKRFPTAGSLAASSLGDVLREWQGLGYNRRAKMLHEAAKAVTASHRGRLPRAYAELLALPGIGTYTAKAVRVFAWNESEALIETNVRTVMIHHFFKRKKAVSDREILEVIEASLDMKNPREWYAGLMDYGSHLKKTVPNPSRKSLHHAKQKPFKGSDREVRGAILRALLSESQTVSNLSTRLPFGVEQIQTQVRVLSKEGLIVLKRGVVNLP